MKADKGNSLVAMDRSDYDSKMTKPFATPIPVDKACTYIRTKLENDDTLSERTQLDIDDILRLLQFVLSNSFSLQRHNIQTNSWMCNGQSC